MTAKFGERIAARVAGRESQIVLGLDPDPAALWPGCDGGAGSPAQRAAAAVAAHCRALIDAAGPACVAVKPQLACFERLGAAGWQVLRELIEHAREAGLLVIADGKRGDIDVSATAYGQALFGGVDTPFGVVGGLRADIATVNPLMGSDAIAPFVVAARECSAAVLLLVRTSNPGAADIEDLELADGSAVWEHTARLVDRLGRPSETAELDRGEREGGEGEGGERDRCDRDHRERICDVGAVMGATAPGHLLRARELMPRSLFLLPGVGAQGGRIEELAPAFAPGAAGALVSASRSISGAHLQRGGPPPQAARAEAEHLREAAWRLSAGG